jgi:hypothetical protein
METGQPFLMPNKNKILNNNDLSIHIFMDRFYFCTQSKIEYIPLLEDPQDFHKTLIEYLDYHSKENFNAFSLISFHNPSTFVPLSFFNKSFCEDYLCLYSKEKKDEIVNYDKIEQISQINVYTCPRHISNDLKKINLSLETFHYNTLLLNNILSLELSNELEYQLFIHLQSEALDVFLFQKKQFKFNNRFLISNEDEFLYYLFFIVEQFEMETEGLEIVFLGKIQRYKTYYKALNQYHNNIKFVDGDNNKIENLLTHPAPYLANIFS